MSKKILTTLGTLLLTFQVASAQTVLNSLEDVWKYADEHNTSIKVANYQLDKVQAATRQSYLGFLPVVSATSNFTNNTNLQTTLVPKIIVDKNAKDGEVVPVQFGQKYIYQAGVTAQMDVLNLQTWFNVRIARETEELNKIALTNSRKSVYRQLASQYYSYLLAKEAARLAVQSQLITDSVCQSVQHKFDEGTVNEPQLDIAKINKARTELTLITASYQAQTALNALKGLLDMSVTDSLEIPGTLKNNIALTENTTFAEDPLIKQAYYQTKIAISRLKATNSGFVPTVALGYSSSAQQNDNKFEPFQSGGPTWYPASYWSVRATWNIFTSGSRWLASTQAKITREQTQMEYEAAIKQSAISDDNLRIAYRKTQALLAKSESIMVLSLDNYTHISARYDAGLSTLDERLNAFSDYIGFQNQYLNSLSDALVQTYLMKIRTK